MTSEPSYAPALREDLRIISTAAHKDGSPAWIIEDPLANRHFRIGWLEFEFLAHWHLSTADALAQISASTSLQPALEQLDEFINFLKSNHLLRNSPQETQALAARDKPNPWLHWRWWLHHYLFFRIPLIRPQARLEKLAGLLSWVFTPATLIVVLMLTLTGLILTVRQWDVFSNTFFESLSTEGLLGFAGALIVAKTLHELGHALVATRLGVRVGHMGVAFLVMWPMLYTDTSESWRLSKSRQRLAIAGAGIATELMIAGLATLAWALTQPSPMAKAFFYLATTSWTLSLALNASPFMRFDGYFILSDWLDFPNLHERSGALARTWLRRTLLGFADPWSEPLPSQQRTALITFALLTWLYRLILFIGIALAVYYMFFKALGILLFIVEISWFIVLPCWRELRVWIERRHAIASGYKRVYLLLGAVFLGLLAAPLPSSISAPAVAHAEREWTAYSPTAARIQQISHVAQVTEGHELVHLEVPDLEDRASSIQADVRAYNAKLAGVFDQQQGLLNQAANSKGLAQELARAQSISAEQQRLLLLAPFAGVWLDTPDDLQAGTWVSARQALGILIDPARWVVIAYVNESEVDLLRIGAAGCFYPEHSLQRLCGKLQNIALSPSVKLDRAQLATVYGGPISVVSRNNQLIPEKALYAVHLQLNEVPQELREQRGKLHLQGERRSLLGHWLTISLSVLIRESGW
jgi:putative peptide zinc metalloprotease protein